MFYLLMWFDSCREYNLSYLSVRCWIGLWICVILLLMVAFDLSALVRYITRFTEESFATLIALIFIVEAFKKLLHINNHYPFNSHHGQLLDYTCECRAPSGNGTGNDSTAGKPHHLLIHIHAASKRNLPSSGISSFSKPSYIFMLYPREICFHHSPNNSNFSKPPYNYSVL